MNEATFRDSMRRLTKLAGGKLPDELRRANREVLTGGFDAGKGEPALAAIAKFAESVAGEAAVVTVLRQAEQRNERRGAGSDRFDEEALRRTTQDEDEHGEQRTEDGGADDGSDSAGVSDPVAGLD